MFNILHINSSTHVVYTTQLLSKCMPSELVTAFYESKDKFAAMFDATVETPLYLWNEKMKTELKTVLKERYREFFESTELKEDLHLVDYNVVNQEFKLRDLYVRYFYNSKEFVYSNNEVLLDSLFKWIDLEVCLWLLSYASSLIICLWLTRMLRSIEIWTERMNFSFLSLLTTSTPLLCVFLSLACSRFSTERGSLVCITSLLREAAIFPS